jgi:large subunit ribosomal protein L24
MKIKKGDTVLVISGKWKGKVGKVLKAFPKEKKVLVEGVNIVKKHLRAGGKREKGQIIEIEKPIYVSKVKLICPQCKMATRVGYEKIGDEKYRVCKKCKAKFP